MRLNYKEGAFKMKKKVLHSITLLLAIVIIAVGIYSAPIIETGYSMYKNAIAEKSLEEAINKVRSDDSYIELEDVSDRFVSEVLKSEDKRFYYHPGIDIIATIRAVYNNIREQSFAQGGSTITQQVAKNLYFSFDKKMERKVAEVFVVADLERMMTKDGILELYLNIAYFGEGCYGLKEAAEHYYNASPKSLSPEQVSALVFTLKSPNNYNPNVYESKNNRISAKY